MGFYGNIQNSNKTAFTFDLIYSSRYAMEKATQIDGVFLGRYILVDYDEAPIQGWFRKPDPVAGEKGWFYTDSHYSASSRITNPVPNALYENLNANMSEAQRFYYYNANPGVQAFEEVTVNENTDGILISDSPYATSYTIDTRRYGRGYDSTVWQKTYDHTKQEYKYIMLAELNAKTPNFHLTVDPPTETPVAPYFDRDSTTMDYYLHLSPAYGNRVRFLEDIPDNDKDKTITLSDEIIDRTDITFGYSDIGEATWKEVPKNGIPADIFYNKAGFEPGKRTFSDVTNTINYDKVASGRIYQKQDGPVYQGGKVFDDTYEWFFRLPAIGNAICTLWDEMYGYNENNIRYREVAQKDSDEAEHLVTYDKSTMYGLLNNVRDLMGHQFIDISKAYMKDEKEQKITLQQSLINKETQVYVDNIYHTFDNPETTKDESLIDTVNYTAINTLYYTIGDNGAIGSYWYYAYNPTFESIKAAPSLTGEYYFKDGDNYILANPALYRSTDANGNLLATDYTIYYTRQDRWTLTELNKTLPEDTLHGMIVKLHKLIGTGDIDTRDEKTLEGCINRIGDIISYIDLKLAPGRLMHTNNDGVIETTDDTYFPSADWDRNGVLDGGGNWVSRFSTIQVCDNSENANRKVEKVVQIAKTNKTVDATPAILQNSHTTLQSDNTNTHTGTTFMYHQSHEPDTLIFATRDKWIKLHPDANDDSIEFEHAQSAIANSMSYQDPNNPNEAIQVASPDRDANSNANTNNFKAGADGTIITIMPDSDTSILYNGQQADNNDNRLTIPMITVDNAGHVVAASTRNFNIPHSFKRVHTANASTDVGSKATSTKAEDAGVTADSLAQVRTMEAEKLTDDLTLSASNKWIRLGGTENNDTISIGHEIHKISTLSSAEDMDTATNKNDKFTTQVVNWDNAGHIISHNTKTWTLPDSIHDLKVTGTSTAVTNPAGTNGTIAADTTFDVVELNASNKWVRLTADPTNDIITFGHLVQNIETGKRTTDLNSSGTFDTEEYTYDEAGHIRSKHVRTLTLPYGYKTIKVGNSNADSTMMIRPNGTEIIATNQVDSYSLNGGNKWINVAAGASENGSYIQISHTTVKDGASYTGTDTSFDTFGGKVTLYGYKTDNAGHIIENPTYTLTLPKGSYNESGGDAGANVLTSLSFTDTSGALVGTKVNIGTLKITGYSTNNMTAKAISATNTLNEALALLQLEINAETVRATKAESTLQTNLNTEATTRSSEDGKLQTAINTETTNRSTEDGKLQTAINTEASTRSSEDSKLQAAINTEATNRTSADNALQEAIDAVDDRVTTLSDNVYTKTNTYTKTEVNNAISALYTKAQVDQAIKDAISAFATANGLTVPTT